MVEKKKNAAEQQGQPAGSGEKLDSVAVELRKAMDESGKSFSDLHRDTGLSRTTLHQYESGARKPGAREIRLLCDALLVTPNRLIYGTEQPFQKKSRLHELLDLSNEDLRTMRLSILLMMLSKEERDAWITLLGESIKARTGGGEKLDETLNAIEIATEVMVGEVAGVFSKALPEQKISEIGREIEAQMAQKVKASSSQKPKK